MFYKVLLKILLCFTSFSIVANEQQLVSIVANLADKGQPLSHYSFYVIEHKHSFALTGGKVSPRGEAITPQHVFRIASITKTFTAATALRLIEQGKFTLNTSLDKLIDKKYDELLKSDGYNTKNITLKHILTHTAGLHDHSNSQQFFDQILLNPNHQWTPEQQIRGAVDWGQPLGRAGEKYVYSDTGYVLLGNIIERASGLSLPMAVRHYLKFEQHQLHQIMWERGDVTKVNHGLRVHQFYQGMDTFDWDSSIDLYGGGGLVATPKAMANFFKLLFNHRIFDQTKTLEIMLANQKLPIGSPYRIGLFERKYNGQIVYEHSGFWGTLVMYQPATKTVIAGAVTHQNEFKNLVAVMSQYLQTSQTTSDNL